MLRTISSSFARPADTTAYASGDLVAESTTAGSVAGLRFGLSESGVAGPVKIQRVRLYKTGTSVTNASFRVHFYQATPTVTNGDNGVWLSNQAGYLGSIDVTVDKAFSDGAGGVAAFADGNQIVANLAENRRHLFALVEARAAYTPASGEVFTVTVEGDDIETPTAHRC